MSRHSSPLVQECLQPTQGAVRKWMRLGGWIYAIRVHVPRHDESEWPIKVGITADVRNRIGQLAGANPFPLSVLSLFPAYRGNKTEAAIHASFALARLHLEWFRPTDDLLAFLGRAEAAFLTHPGALFEMQRSCGAEIHRADTEWTTQYTATVVDTHPLTEWTRLKGDWLALHHALTHRLNEGVPFIQAENVAAALGCPAAAVLNAAKRGELPHSIVGARYTALSVFFGVEALRGYAGRRLKERAA